MSVHDYGRYSVESFKNLVRYQGKSLYTSVHDYVGVSLVRSLTNCVYGIGAAKNDTLIEQVRYENSTDKSSESIHLELSTPTYAYK